LQVTLVVAFAGCAAPASIPPPPPASPIAATLPLVFPLQIKSAREFVVHAEPVAYTLASGELSIDGRVIPLAGDASWDAIARQVARVPKELRPLMQTLAVSATPSPLDDMYTKKYKAPVKAGMTSTATGNITIYPHGVDELADPDGFVRNLMHELGHTWSLAAWDGGSGGAAALARGDRE
jgi:hypothetical protein